MKNRMMKVLALLLAFCLLIGSGTVLAADATVDVDGDKVSVEVAGDIESESANHGSGVRVDANQDFQGSPSSAVVLGDQPVDLQGKEKGQLESITLDAENVKSSAKGEVEGFEPPVTSDGAFLYSNEGAEVNASVGDISSAAIAQNKETQESDNYVNAQAQGIMTQPKLGGDPPTSPTGNVNLEAGKVSSEATATIKDVSGFAQAMATGIQGNSYQDTTTDIKTGSVAATATANASGNQTYSSADATGIQALSYGTGKTTVIAEDVTSIATAKNASDDSASSANANGIIALQQNETVEGKNYSGEVIVNAKAVTSKGDNGATGIQAGNNGGKTTVGATDVNVDASQFATGINAYSGTSFKSESTTTINSEGNSELTIKSKKDNIGETTVEVNDVNVHGGQWSLGIQAGMPGAYMPGSVVVRAGGINSTSDENAAGIIAKSFVIFETESTDEFIGRGSMRTKSNKNTAVASGETTVETGDIVAKGGKSATGIEADANGGITTVKAGDVTAEAESEATGIRATVSSAYDYEYNFGENEPRREGEHSTPGEVSVFVNNVTAKGEEGIAIYAQGDEIKDNKDTSSRINIVAEGTVTGEDVAIKVLGESTVTQEIARYNPDTQQPVYEVVTENYKYDTDNINLTVWSVNENANGEIIRVVKTSLDSTDPEFDGEPTETVDQEASRAMEARINYIVKVADGVMPRIAVTTAKGNTVIIGDKTYNTANENEEVTLHITLAEDEVLEGIYYNGDDESSLTAADQLIRDSQGGYVLNMMRGGGMLVGLKIHKHTPGAAVTENSTATGYDTVVYCSTCGAEMSRSHTTITPEPTPVIPEVPAVVPAVTPAAAPAPAATLQFVAVDENTPVNGVKVADHLPIEETFAIIGATLDDENATVTIPGMDQILNASELARFESLKASDRLMVVLSIIGATDVMQVSAGNMSDEAKALVADIEARIANMTDDEKEAFNQLIRQLFDVKKDIVDGVERDTICIELDVEKNGQTTKDKYSFYDDNGTWKLYKIETEEYVAVN